MAATSNIPLIDPQAEVNAALAALRLTSTPANVNTNTKLSVPLDNHVIAINKDKTDPEIPSLQSLKRRDSSSTKRRDALIKGREGSRRRRRWENDHLLHIPNAEPPLPVDWEVRPTYPVHHVNYALASLWDSREKERDRIRTNIQKQKQQQREETLLKQIPKPLKDRLKKSRGAKGILQDLEQEVREFVKLWEESQGLDVESVHEDEKEDEDDFVYIPSSNTSPHSSQMISSPFQNRDRSCSIETVHIIQREKLIYCSSLDEDASAKFVRYLVHCLGRYYDLDTWSITKNDPARREAYVGMKADTYSRALLRPLYAMV